MDFEKCFRLYITSVAENEHRKRSLVQVLESVICTQPHNITIWKFNKVKLFIQQRVWAICAHDARVFFIRASKFGRGLRSLSFCTRSWLFLFLHLYSLGSILATFSVMFDDINAIYSLARALRRAPLSLTFVLTLANWLARNTDNMHVIEKNRTHI